MIVVTPVWRDFAINPHRAIEVPYAVPLSGITAYAHVLSDKPVTVHFDLPFSHHGPKRYRTSHATTEHHVTIEFPGVAPVGSRWTMVLENAGAEIANVKYLVEYQRLPQPPSPSGMTGSYR